MDQQNVGQVHNKLAPFAKEQVVKARRKKAKQKAVGKLAEKVLKSLGPLQPPGIFKRCSAKYDVHLRKKFREIGTDIQNKVVMDLQQHKAHLKANATVKEMSISGDGLVNENMPPLV